MKLRVNLYSADLLPVKQRLSFLRLCQAFVGLIILLLFCSAITLGLNSRLESDKKQLTLVKSRLDSEKQDLETALAQRGPNKALVAEVELKAQQLELKRKLFDKLNKEEELTSYSYSPLMTDLANVANTKIWLERIHVDENSYIFEGFTSTPQSVPLWVEKLKTTKTLKGHAFASMTMDLGENQPLAFKLTSGAEAADKEAIK